MSMERCKTCNTNVDTDYNAEHFPCEDDEEVDDSFQGQAKDALMEAGLTDDEAEAMIDDFLT